MDKRGYVNQFTQVRKSLVETVLNYPDDKLGKIVSGEWNIKCVMAHIAGWDTYFTMISEVIGVRRRSAISGR